MIRIIGHTQVPLEFFPAIMRTQEERKRVRKKKKEKKNSPLLGTTEETEGEKKFQLFPGKMEATREAGDGHPEVVEMMKATDGRLGD